VLYSKEGFYNGYNMLYEILFRTNGPIATKLKLRAVATQIVFNFVKNTYSHLRKNGKSPKDIEEMLREAFDDVFGESMARNLTWWNENYIDTWLKGF
jgi:hypothetical protein